MALVTITGKLTDAGGKVIPASQQPRLYAVPSKPSAWGPAALTDDEVLANLNPTTGAFSVQVENAPDVQYSLWLDRLLPGQETEPPERRARNWVMWKEPFDPGTGGDVGDLSPVVGVEVLWIGPTPPPTFQKNTRWLDSRPSSPDYGWIKKWKA